MIVFSFLNTYSEQYLKLKETGSLISTEKAMNCNSERGTFIHHVSMLGVLRRRMTTFEVFGFQSGVKPKRGIYVEWQGVSFLGICNL